LYHNARSLCSLSFFMARLPFSIYSLTTRAENVIEFMLESLATVVTEKNTRKIRGSSTPSENSSWRARTSYVHIAASSSDSTASVEHDKKYLFMEETNRTDTAASSYDNLPRKPVSQNHRAKFLCEKILPAGDDTATDENVSDDGRTFYSYDSGQHSSAESSVNPQRQETTKTLACLPESTEGMTALSPPPLHLSGRTRSNVVFIPRETYGTCPIHYCADCGLCDESKPLLLII